MSIQRPVDAARNPRRWRLTASIAVSVAVVLITAGCAFITPQGTKIPYSPSDGVAVEGSEPLQVRNAIVVANPEGTAGNLVAAIVNPTDDTLTLRLEVGESRTAATVRVPANSVVSLGAEGTKPLALKDFDAPPGSDVEIYFQSGDRNGVRTAVPVVDGSLSYYADLAPTAAPTR